MAVARYVPDHPFPPYAYVPGHSPHPKRTPAGHMHGEEEPTPPPMDPADPWGSPAFLFGIDLYNAGYYWESHVWWEGLWHAHGRRGVVADLLKGLIRLAAAGVKAKAGSPGGVRGHALAARDLLAGVQARTGPTCAGLDLETLATGASGIAEAAEDLAARGPGPGPVLPVALTLAD